MDIAPNKLSPVAHAPLLIGSPAPLFCARTTMGDVSLCSYRGRWLVFFSHPADFTPVCTSEFIGFAKAFDRFRALGCDLLGLSVDSLFAHVAWVRDIHSSFGVKVPFPLAEDPSMAIARAYGMIDCSAASSATVRATFVIDPEGVIRAMIWYPMTTGRSVAEILRLVAALQTSDAADVSTPEGWVPGGKIIDVPSIGPTAAAEDGPGWYFRLRELGDHI